MCKYLIHWGIKVLFVFWHITHISLIKKSYFNAWNVRNYCQIYSADFVGLGVFSRIMTPQIMQLIYISYILDLFNDNIFLRYNFLDQHFLRKVDMKWEIKSVPFDNIAKLYRDRRHKNLIKCQKELEREILYLNDVGYYINRYQKTSNFGQCLRASKNGWHF